MTVPFVSLFDVINKAFSTMKIDSMHSVEHEDTEDNSDFSVDPLSDTRLDRMDLFNMVDSRSRDEIMNATAPNVGTLNSLENPETPSESPSDSGSGE